MYYFIYFIFKALVLLSEMLARGPIHQIERDAVLVEGGGCASSGGSLFPVCHLLKLLGP